MSKIYVDAVEPEGASTVLTLGTVGDTVILLELRERVFLVVGLILIK